MKRKLFKILYLSLKSNQLKYAMKRYEKKKLNKIKKKIVLEIRVHRGENTKKKRVCNNRSRIDSLHCYCTGYSVDSTPISHLI